jgi:hypothetical protein
VKDEGRSVAAEALALVMEAVEALEDPSLRRWVLEVALASQEARERREARVKAPEKASEYLPTLPTGMGSVNWRHESRRARERRAKQ